MEGLAGFAGFLVTGSLLFTVACLLPLMFIAYSIAVLTFICEQIIHS